MLSLAAKSHWRLAYSLFKKALKVTLQDIKQQFKARYYINKVSDDILDQRRAIATILKKAEWEENE